MSKYKPKEYPCPFGMCRYGGNKWYDYGFMRGTAGYCRLEKQWTADMKECPLKRELPGVQG